MIADARDVIRQITHLARTGALERAWSLYEASGLAQAVGDPRALALGARLAKDRARQAQGSERVRWLKQAAANYLRSSEIEASSYSLINAATLSLLAGRPDRAREIARRVLEQLETDPEEAETRYWLGATRAEALLLLGKLTEARAAMQAAVLEAPEAWEDQAATIGQFLLICAELSCDAAWLNQFRPPRSLQYTGIMEVAQHDEGAEARLAEWLDAENVGFGFGALAAGADIWIAEALAARSAKLNVVLPCPLDVFREQSVAAVDPAWLPRFDRLIDRADLIYELDAAPAPSPAAVKLTDAVSLGLAIHNASILQSEPVRLRITDNPDSPDRLPSGRVREVALPARRLFGSGHFHVDDANAVRVVLRAARAEDTDAEAAWYDSPMQGWEAACRLASDRVPVALDYRFGGQGATGDGACARLDAMADAAGPGQILASAAIAFALRAEVPDIRVESLGHIRNARGVFPV